MALPVVTKERLDAQLASFELNYGEDDTGDFTLAFPNMYVCIGLRENMFFAWCIWNSLPVPAEQVAMFATHLNEHHKILAMGKLVLVVEPDRRSARVQCELAVPINLGMTDKQLNDVIHASLGVFAQVCNRLDEEFPEMITHREQGE